MITSETISFIKQRFQNGASEETIRADLLKSGYSEEDIKIAIDSAKDLISQITPVFQEQKISSVASTITTLFAWFFALIAILFSSWYIYTIYKDGKAPDVIGEISKQINQLKKISVSEEMQTGEISTSTETIKQ